MSKIVVSDRSRSAAIGVALVMFIYGVMILWIFIRSDGLPYGFDNNETFSNLIQGRNILEFSSTNPFLVTDESTAGVVNGHPYLYTHGQNFPRFVAAFLLFLGITGAETHMFLSAAAGGLVVILLIFLAVRRIAGAFVGTVSAAFAASSVLYFLQMAPNTWRIWQSIVLAATLYLVATKLSGTNRPRLWMSAAAGISFLAVSVELTFGLSIAAVLLLTSLVWQPLRSASTWLSALAGPVGFMLGAGLLFSQLLGTFGLGTTLDDLRYTFVSRNRGGDESAAEAFFLENNIAFWRNSLEVDFSSTGTLVFGPLSEFLAYGIGWLAVLSLLLSTALFLEFRKEKPTPTINGVHQAAHRTLPTVAVASLATIVFLIAGQVTPGGVAVIAGISVGALFGLGVFGAGHLATLATSRYSTAFMGLVGGSSLVLWVYVITVFASLVPQPQVQRRDLLLFIVGAVAAIFWYRVSNSKSPRPSFSAFAKASFTTALVALLLVATLPATAQIVRVPIDLGMRNSPGLQVFAVLIAWLIAGTWTVNGNFRSSVPDPSREAVVRLAYLFGIFLAGASLVYLLSPGYLLTGYSSRLVPFFGLVLPAVTGAAAAIMIRQFGNPGYFRSGNFKPFHGPAAWLATTLFGVWFATNSMLIPQLFNNDFSIAYRTLQAQGPVGVVSTSYPAPWAAAADTWAYLDQGVPSSPDLGQVLEGEQYVWIRGALGNPEFQSPNAAVCWSPILPSQLLVQDSLLRGACKSDLFFNENTQLRPDFLVQDDDARFMIAFGGEVVSHETRKID